jgi:hypothetical protein
MAVGLDAGRSAASACVALVSDRAGASVKATIPTEQARGTDRRTEPGAWVAMHESPARKRRIIFADVHLHTNSEGEGAGSIPSPPEGERDRVRGRVGRGTRVRE